MTQQFAVGHRMACAVAGGMVALVALSGCGGSSDTAAKSAKRPTTHAATTAVPNALVGTWIAKLPAVADATMVRGRYTIKVARDGNAEMYGIGTNTAASCTGTGGCMPFTIT